MALEHLVDDVRSASDGDREAFARLVTATSSLVTAITLAETGDLEASRDAAQEVFLHAWRDLPDLRSPGSFLPWLRELARRRARELTGRRRPRGPVEASEALAAVADPSPDPSARLLDAEARRALAEALDGLPPELRETTLLYYREGRSAAQVAHLLDLTEDAVWQRLSRARVRLRAELLERAGELAARTAPGAGFTAAVVAALGTPAPASAAAAAGAVAKASAAGPLGLMVAGGTLGLLGLRHQLRVLRSRAGDERERGALERYGRANQVVLWVLGVGAPAAALLAGLKAAFVACFGLYALAGLGVQLALLPGPTLARLRAEPGGPAALAFSRGLDLAVAAGCFGLAGYLALR